MADNGQSMSGYSEVDSIDTSYSATAVISGEQEYETQFLGFCPKSFCDGLYNAVQDYVWEYFFASQKYIKNEFRDLISEEELHTAAEVFLNTVSQQIDKAFDKFETYALKNILHIPLNVVLPEDAVQQEYINFSKTEQQFLDDENQDLKERLIAAKYVNASLINEYKQLKGTQDQYTKFLDLLRAMDSTMKAAGVHDLHGSLKYTIEKTNKVLALLNHLPKDALSKRKLPPPVDFEQIVKKRKVLKSDKITTDSGTIS